MPIRQLDLGPYKMRPKELPTCRSALGMVEGIEIILPPEEINGITNTDLEVDYEFHVWHGHQRRSRGFFSRRWQR